MVLPFSALKKSIEKWWGRKNTIKKKKFLFLAAIMIFFSFSVMHYIFFSLCFVEKRVFKEDSIIAEKPFMKLGI